MNENGEPAKLYRIRDASDGSFYYAQVGKNGEDLNVSETYTRRDDARRGIFDANPETDPADLEIVDESAQSER